MKRLFSALEDNVCPVLVGHIVPFKKNVFRLDKNNILFPVQQADALAVPDNRLCVLGKRNEEIQTQSSAQETQLPHTQGGDVF